MAAPGQTKWAGTGSREAAPWRHRPVARARAANDRTAVARRWTPGSNDERVNVSQAHRDRTPPLAPRVTCRGKPATFIWASWPDPRSPQAIRSEERRVGKEGRAG